MVDHSVAPFDLPRQLIDPPISPLRRRYYWGQGTDSRFTFWTSPDVNPATLHNFICSPQERCTDCYGHGYTWPDNRSVAVTCSRCNGSGIEPCQDQEIYEAAR